MKLGLFKVIAEPDPPPKPPPEPCWLYRNVRVKGFVGEVDRPTDQYILRPIDHVFQEAVTCVRTVLPDGRVEMPPSRYDQPPVMLPDALLEEDENCARIVEAKPIDEFGSICFKFKYWGVPEE